MQKGVSIFIVIVVMTILLGIALGLNAISVRQLRNLRDIGNSVIALYAADAGIERILRVDICISDPVEATRRDCIQTAIDDSGFIDADCEGEPITGEQLCREHAINAVDATDRVLGNSATYELGITAAGGGCAATNYCGTSAGTFKEATRKIEILR